MQSAIAKHVSVSKTTTVQPSLLIMLRTLLVSLLLYVYSRPGFHLQVITLGMVSGWLLWKGVRRQYITRSPLTWPLIGSLGAATIATLFSIDRRLSLESLLLLLGLVVVFFVISDLLVVGWHPQIFINALLLLVTMLLGQGLLVLVEWYWNWYAMRVPEYLTFPVDYRLYGLDLHPNHFAALLNLALPFVIVRLVQSRGVASRVGWGLWLLVADIELFYSRSRGSWVAAAAMGAIAVIWLVGQRLPQRGGLRDWTRRTWRLWAAMTAYVAVFAMLFAISTSLSGSEFTTNGGSVSDGGGRWLFWKIAWQDFISHPLTGSGPQTFGYMFMRAVPSIRTWLAAHAHNLYLDTLAQQGILGGLALSWIILVGGWSLVRGWRRARPEQQTFLMAVSIALVGILVHSLFDVVTTLPTNALLIVMLSAVGLHGAAAFHQPASRTSRGMMLSLAVPLALAVVLFRWNAGWSALQQAAVDAEEHDWVAAAQALDHAVEADPQLALYDGQRGYANAVLALPVSGAGNSAARTKALASYERALSESNYIPDLLNAAALLDEADARQQAQQLLERAAQMRSDWALPALLLADRYAAQGRTVEADALFTRAFETEPQAREMAACRRSAACREAALRMPVQSDTVLQSHTDGQALLKQGRPEQALAVFNRVSSRLAAPLPWLDRADAHLALGQVAQARYALRMASILGDDAPATAAHAALTRSHLYAAEGKPEAAIDLLEYVVRPKTGVRPYDFFIFGRVGLPGMLVPKLDLLTRTTEDLEVYRQLAVLYAAQGHVDDARWAQEQADALSALLTAR